VRKQVLNTLRYARRSCSPITHGPVRRDACKGRERHVTRQNGGNLIACGQLGCSALRDRDPPQGKGFAAKAWSGHDSLRAGGRDPSRAHAVHAD
jgi:hypothetical protein